MLVVLEVGAVMVAVLGPLTCAHSPVSNELGALACMFTELAAQEIVSFPALGVEGIL